MSEGENRQLLVAAAAAALVLGGGAFLWFGASEEPAPAISADVSKHTIAPAVSNGTEEPGRLTPTPDGADALTPQEKVEQAEKNRKKAPPPSLLAGLKEPRVRPNELTDAVWSALKPLESTFQGCYDELLVQEPQARGRVILIFDLEDGSLTSDVTAELRAINSLSFRDCLLRAVPEADFSVVAGRARVLWPLVMWPDRGLSLQDPVEDL